MAEQEKQQAHENQDHFPKIEPSALTEEKTNINHPDLFSSPTEAVENKFEDAISMSARINNLNDSDDDLDIPTFLRKDFHKSNENDIKS